LKALGSFGTLSKLDTILDIEEHVRNAKVKIDLNIEGNITLKILIGLEIMVVDMTVLKEVERLNIVRRVENIMQRTKMKLVNVERNFIVKIEKRY